VGLVVLVATAGAAIAPAGATPSCTTEQVTTFSGGSQTTFLDGRALDADGNRIAFLSDTDPVGGNPDGNGEVFLLKPETGSITQITNTTGASANSAPSISDDGRLLAFTSTRNLSQNADLNREVFVFDGATGTFTNLTASSGGGSTANTSAEISGDGRTVAYLSTRNPLNTNGDGNAELFTVRRDTLVRRQITASTTGSVGFPSLADDGALLAFPSSRNLTGGNRDGSTELFTFDTATLTTTQRTTTFGASIGGQVDVEGVGRQVAFTSASNLDPAGSLGGNADGSSEVFLLTSTSTVVQVTAGDDLDSASPSVAESGDGAGFTTEPVAGLGLGTPRHRDATGVTVQLPSPGFATATAIDDGGEHVLFRSSAALGAGGFAGDLFLATCT
jgi:Tol biopolymer transport system component